jgi:hypothetical protein
MQKKTRWSFTDFASRRKYSLPEKGCTMMLLRLMGSKQFYEKRLIHRQHRISRGVNVMISTWNFNIILPLSKKRFARLAGWHYITYLSTTTKALLLACRLACSYFGLKRIIVTTGVYFNESSVATQVFYTQDSFDTWAAFLLFFELSQSWGLPHPTPHSVRDPVFPLT